MTIIWVLLLYIGGLLLIMAEFFVPGAICGFFGGVMVFISATLAYRTYPDYGLFIVVAELAGVLAGIVMGFKILPHTRIGKAMILSAAQPHDEGWVAVKSDMSLLGAEGEVYSPLRPAGKVLVNGERLDAVSTGDLIEAGVKIRIIEVRGSRIVVETVE